MRPRVLLRISAIAFTAACGNGDARSGAVRPLSLAADEDGVFVADVGKGLVVDDPATARVQVVRGGAVDAPIAVDDRYAYFVVDDSVRRVAKAGGADEVLGRVPGTVTSIAVDDDGVFVASTTGDNATAGVGTISALPKAGGPPATLATSDGVLAVATSSKSVVWTGGVDGKTSGVYSVPKSGGATRTLVRAAYAVNDTLAVDERFAWYVERGPTVDSAAKTQLARVPLEGGSPEPLVTDDLGIIDLVRSSGFVLFRSVERTTGQWQISSVPEAGGRVTRLAGRLDLRANIAADATDVFFARSASPGSDDASIERVAFR